MKPLLMISLCLALFGSWQLCQAFSVHTQKTFALNPIQRQATLVPFIASCAFATAGTLYFYFSFNFELPGWFLWFCSGSTMVYFGIRIRQSTNRVTSILAVIVFTLFCALLTIAAHALVSNVTHSFLES